MSIKLFILAGIILIIFISMMIFIVKSFIKLRKEELSYIPKAASFEIVDNYIPQEVIQFHAEKIRNYSSKKFIASAHLYAFQKQPIIEQENYEPEACY